MALHKISRVLIQFAVSALAALPLAHADDNLPTPGQFGSGASDAATVAIAPDQGDATSARSNDAATFESAIFSPFAGVSARRFERQIELPWYATLGASDMTLGALAGMAGIIVLVYFRRGQAR